MPTVKSCMLAPDEDERDPASLTDGAFSCAGW